MKTISWQAIENILDDLDEKSGAEMTEIVKKMSDTQPDLLVYLMAVSEDFATEEEKELFFFLGISIWLIFSAETSDLSRISDKTLDRAEQKNEALFRYLENQEGTFFDFAQEIKQDHNQHNLLDYVLETLFDGESVEPNAAIFFIYLKTVIDALDQRFR